MSTDLAYRAERPILLVHGAWHGSWSWNEHWTPYLRDAGFPVRSISLPKHRQPGSHKRIWPSMGKYVRHVRAHLDELGPDTVLVGHSMGGLIVQRALERQTGARGAVLVASAPRNGVGPLVVRLLRHHPLRTLRMLATLTLHPAISTPERVREVLFRPETDESVVRATADQVQNESYRAFVSMLLRRVVPRRVHIPVAVMAAADDGVFTMAEQQRLAKAYGTEPIVIDGSGHDIMLDDAWLPAVEALVQWIDDH